MRVGEATHKEWCFQRPPKIGQREKENIQCVVHGSQVKELLGEAELSSLRSQMTQGLQKDHQT